MAPGAGDPGRHWPAISAATGLSPRRSFRGWPRASPPPTQSPAGATAALVLADGTVFWGRGFGAHTRPAHVGEVCFNTGMTGYQETLTDPSYAGQIITFTFPHIGNVGANPEDIEATTIAARGLVVKQDVTEPSNWRATQTLDAWLQAQDIPGHRRRRHAGADPPHPRRRPAERRARLSGGRPVRPRGAARRRPRPGRGSRAWISRKQVSCTQSYRLGRDALGAGPTGFGRQDAPRHHVVAVDYGAKRNILRCLAAAGCRVTVVPATATAEDILRHEPDGVFLSNGPGDPAATGAYAVPVHPRRDRDAACRSSASASATSCWRWRSARAPTSWTAAIAAPTSR